MRTHRRRILIGSIVVTVIVVAGAIWSLFVFHPLPPRTVTMTTGLEGGAYHEFGLRYRVILARSGIDLRLLPSEGAIENLRRLRDPRSGVQAGLAQGGTTNELESPGLASLGTIAYEPLWFFYRGTHPGRRLEGLRGRRISIGPEGSGTRSLAVELLSRSGIEPGIAEFLPLTPKEAGEGLLDGRIDAALMVAAWDSPVVQRLSASGKVERAGFRRPNRWTCR